MNRIWNWGEGSVRVRIGRVAEGRHQLHVRRARRLVGQLEMERFEQLPPGDRG